MSWQKLAFISLAEHWVLFVTKFWLKLFPASAGLPFLIFFRKMRKQKKSSQSCLPCGTRSMFLRGKSCQKNMSSDASSEIKNFRWQQTGSNILNSSNNAICMPYYSIKFKVIFRIVKFFGKRLKMLVSLTLSFWRGRSRFLTILKQRIEKFG